MEMWTRNASRCSDFAHDVAGFDAVSFHDVDGRHVAQVGIQTHSVIEDDRFTRVIQVGSQNNAPGIGCAYRCADRTAKIGA